MKKIVPIIIVLVFSIFMFHSCDNFENNLNKKGQSEWVYLEIKTIMNKDTSYSFIYGQISKSIVKKIKENKNAEGLFLLENARYVNDDNLLQLYEDENDSGVLGFRIENIKYIEFYKRDPMHFKKTKKNNDSLIKSHKENNITSHQNKNSNRNKDNYLHPF